MMSSKDFLHVAYAIKIVMGKCCVPFKYFDINIVDTTTESPEVYSYNFVDKLQWKQVVSKIGKETILKIWRNGIPDYRKDLEKSDIY